jgi:D-threo-aldose 1-dehydrogenase
VSPLGFGSTALGNIMRETTDAEAAAAVEAAWSAGLRYFDTAPQYGQGLAEQRLGAALRSRPRDEFVLSTKVGKLLRPAPDGRAPEGIFVNGGAFEIEFDYSYDATMRSLEASLQRMGMDRVDILLIHDVNRRYHGERVHERLAEALNGAVKALSRLRDEGVIRAFGPAFNDVDILMRFVAEADIDCMMLPRGYSLLNQHAAPELLPECLRRRIAVLIASPFESGILATGAGPGATYLYGPADARGPGAREAHRGGVRRVRRPARRSCAAVSGAPSSDCERGRRHAQCGRGARKCRARAHANPAGVLDRPQPRSVSIGQRASAP